MVVIGAVIAIVVTGTGTGIEIVTATTETATDVIATVIEIGTVNETAMEEGMTNLANGIMKMMAMTTLAQREGIENFKLPLTPFRCGSLWWVSLKVLPYPFLSSVFSHG